MSAPCIAVIGCGAIAESFHLPALVRDQGLQDRLVLVDPDLGRARAVGAAFGVGDVCGNFQDVLGRVDGAIVTVPHRLHYPIALECVQAGVHVLVEKPLCNTLEEGEALVGAAEDGGVTVSVNNMRRLYPAMRFVKTLIDDGRIGDLQEIDVEEGEPFEWPAASGAYFGHTAEGRGVVLDRGAHVLDLVCWWLGGEPTVRDCHDDAHGGTEAVARMALDWEGVRTTVHLSWLTKLRNTFRIHGRDGTIEVGIYDWDTVWLTKAGLRKRVSAPTNGAKVEDLPRRVMGAFLDVIHGNASPVVSGLDVLPSLGVMQAYYAQRTPLTMPWYDTFDRIAHG